jgi:hypothetical protein
MVPINFSIFSAAGGALLLASCARFPFSVDELLLRARTAPARYFR